jgi:hypothetical protein
MVENLRQERGMKFHPIHPMFIFLRYAYNVTFHELNHAVTKAFLECVFSGLVAYQPDVLKDMKKVRGAGLVLKSEQSTVALCMNILDLFRLKHLGCRPCSSVICSLYERR